jgi:predicted permease
LSESVLLSIAGGALGLLVAGACLKVLRQLAPATLPRVDEIGLDPAVLIFTVAISLAAGVVFGLMPVWRLGSTRSVALNEGGTRVSDGAVRQRMRNALAVAQVAMALVLLVVSGLMIRTFIAMRQVEPGFAIAPQVQTFRVSIPDDIIEDNREFARAHEQISTRLAELPGVASVGLSSHITMDGEDNGNPVWVEHVHVADGTFPPLRRLKTVAPEFFETMGNALVAGRAITWIDVNQATRVVVVSETFAREYWRTPSDAIGKRLRFDDPNVWYEIVGVSGAERDDGLNRPPTAIVYWPLLNDAYMPRTLAYAVRSDRAGTADFVRELQRAVWSINPNLPIAAVQTLDEIESASMAATSFTLTMLAIAATMALLLGTVGIYGVISYSVARRTREIGIRSALGAEQGELERMFLAHALRVVAIGVAVGVLIAAVATRLIASMLFGVTPLDVPTYVAVTLVLAAAAVVASYVPARRAAHVDPLVALRYE